MRQQIFEDALKKIRAIAADRINHKDAWKLDAMMARIEQIAKEALRRE